jgi:hypothetical protein
MLIRRVILLAVVMAPPLFAQSGSSSSARSADSEVRDQWSSVSQYLARSAAAVPESSYVYKPVATVRSFGQLVAHVAGSQMMFCAAALGEPVPPEDDFEKRTMSKAELVKALEQSNTYCARAALDQGRIADPQRNSRQRTLRECRDIHAHARDGTSIQPTSAVEFLALRRSLRRPFQPARSPRSEQPTQLDKEPVVHTVVLSDL